MNRTDLENKCWAYLGFLDSSRQYDWRRQEIRDGLNQSLKIIATSAPYLQPLVRESTFVVTPPTAVYTLNDWCQRSLAAWTETAAAHKVRFRNPSIADRDGSRNPNLALGTLGPWEWVWQPRNTTGLFYGLAGASTGCTPVSGSTTVTLNGYTNAAPTSAAIGRMLRINGEYGDYQITGVGGSSLTIDKPFYARLAMSAGTSQTAQSYSNVKWEVSPPGRIIGKTLPKPSDTQTTFYRYLALPRMILNADDVPEIPEEYHDLLWMGAFKFLDLKNEKNPQLQGFVREFEKACDDFRAQDTELQDVDEAPFYTTLQQNDLRGLPPDTFTRGQY